MTLKLCIAQLNFVGDLAGNSQKIIEAARSAHADSVRPLLTPELPICGQAAEDMFLRPVVIAACDDAVKTVARELAGLKDITVGLGHPNAGDRRTRSVTVPSRHNAASVLCEGLVQLTLSGQRKVADLPRG